MLHQRWNMINCSPVSLIIPYYIKPNIINWEVMKCHIMNELEILSNLHHCIWPWNEMTGNSTDCISTNTTKPQFGYESFKTICLHRWRERTSISPWTRILQGKLRQFQHIAVASRKVYPTKCVPVCTVVVITRCWYYYISDLKKNAIKI